MQAQENLVEKRKSEFEDFYKGLIPALVEFVDRLGVSPAHEVLNHAAQFASVVSAAVRELQVEDAQDRIWLITRIGYFVGEYFAQKYDGCWYVNDIEDSKYFSRYVVGRFRGFQKPTLMLDPFELAQACVDTPPPRQLEDVLAEVDAELKKADVQ